MEGNRAQGPRFWIALVLLTLVAVVAWETLDPGRIRTITEILLGVFAFRVLLYRARSRYDK